MTFTFIEKLYRYGTTYAISSMKRSLTSSEGELPIAKNNMFLYIEFGIVLQPQIRYE